MVKPNAWFLASICHIVISFQNSVMNGTFTGIQSNWNSQSSLTHHVYYRCMMTQPYLRCSDSTKCFVVSMSHHQVKLLQPVSHRLGTYSLTNITFTLSNNFWNICRGMKNLFLCFICSAPTPIVGSNSSQVVYEKIKTNLEWEKHPRGGWIGFFKMFFNTTNSSSIETNIKR